jgi:hypothetical protein
MPVPGDEQLTLLDLGRRGDRSVNVSVYVGNRFRKPFWADRAVE